jgi:hypothetical protein
MACLRTIRVLSHYTIFANGERWVRLTSAAPSHNTARIHLTNQPFATEEGEVPGGTLALTISRVIAEGIHEDLDVTNHGLVPVRFNLEVALRSDFADIFEVKSHKFIRRGRIVTEWDEKRAEVSTSYANRDFYRRFIYRLLNSSSSAVYANGRITFELDLVPGGTWHSCCEYILVHGAEVRKPLGGCWHERGETEHAELQRRWEQGTTSLASSNEDYRLYRQSVEDMGALRLHDHDFGPDVWLPAAGVFLARRDDDALGCDAGRGRNRGGAAAVAALEYRAAAPRPQHRVTVLAV